MVLILMNYMHLLTFNGIHLVIFCFLVLLYSTGLFLNILKKLFSLYIHFSEIIFPSSKKPLATEALTMILNIFS